MGQGLAYTLVGKSGAFQQVYGPNMHWYWMETAFDFLVWALMILLSFYPQSFYCDDSFSSFIIWGYYTDWPQGISI